LILSFGFLVNFAVGVLIGIAASTLGLGGGFLFVPYYHLALGFPMNKAIGSSMASIMFLTGSSAAAYGFQRRIDYRLGVLIEALEIPAVFLGAYLTQCLNSFHLKLAFTILLIFAGLNMFFRLGYHEREGSGKGWKREIIDRWGRRFRYSFNPWLALSGSFGIGIIAGMVGIGGGVLNIPLMSLALNVPIHVAIATSSFISFINSISGSAGHLTFGNIDFYAAITTGLGALLGSQIGSRIAKRTEPKMLRKIFGLVLLGIAIRMIILS
jgi:hypothetical protein